MTRASYIVGHAPGSDVRRVTLLRRAHAAASGSPLAVKALVAAAAACGALALLTGATPAARGFVGGEGAAVVAVAGALSLGLLRRSRWGRLRRIIRHRFARETYDERRILADLSYAARAVVTRAQLFELVVVKIREALGTASVAVFVRDDESGDYPCEILSAPPDEDDPEVTVDASARAPREAPLTLSQDAFVTRRLRRLSMPLTVGAEDYESWARAPLSASGAKREARRRERDALERAGAALLLPVMMKDELVGVMSLGPRRGGHAYTESDKRLLLAVAGQLAFIIENSKLAERIVEEERLRRELRMAAEVQRRLFPAGAPASEWVELAGSCRPARGVGGDYYDFLTLDAHQTGVAVADVAGKGLSAALLMSIVQASLRSQAAAARGGALAGVVATMNQLMYDSTGAASYATFFYAQFDSRSRRLTYVNAGHNPPLLLRAAAPADASDGLEKLTEGGPVIGVIPDCVYQQQAVEVRSGDVLLAYTDGVTEAFNAEGDEFGEGRLIEALRESAHLTAEELRAEVVRRVGAWSGAAPQHDDLTVVVMKVK